MVVVMDADLSHPPEVIPQLIEALDGGAEIAVGSRYVDGGSTADDWGVLRWVNSRVASLLARPLTRLRDPMAGFFALRRSTFEAGTDWNPVGYKILLECVVKCDCRRVAEVPIHFVDRAHGESKLTLREQLLYIRHLRRLYTHRLGTWSHLVQFLAVGASGVLVNLALLTAFLAVGLDRRAAVALAIALSMVWNFELNRRFSFSYARGGSIVRQFLGFVAACSVGAVVNYAVSLGVWELVSAPQLAALTGVLAGTAFNFVFSRFLVFREKRVP
jgi:dolichol-phosphate mannosyltransferase